MEIQIQNAWRWGLEDSKEEMRRVIKQVRWGADIMLRALRFVRRR
jgi:hypothetical protein